jgi:TetR/AcrR family transcriptional regulator
VTDTTHTFQRARKPEEIEARRGTLLAAAAALFDAEGPHGAGLNAIAAKAGFTKSNVYRYFESREDVLLNLFRVELRAFVDAFEVRAASCAKDDLDALAAAAADQFIAQPRFCALLSILNITLEQNVSEAAVISLKRTAAELNLRLAAALASRLSNASIEDCAWATAMTATLVAGIWPSANPSPVAARVVAMPEFAHLKPRMDRDLARAVRALLLSVTTRR